jgi:hypothetical protein
MVMDVGCSKLTDFDSWIALAKEFKPIFGHMADELGFQEASKQAISANAAFCIRSNPNEEN